MHIVKPTSYRPTDEEKKRVVKHMSSILGDKSKMSMILSIYCFGPMMKTDLYSHLTKNSYNAGKLSSLEKAGLMVTTTDRFQNNRTMVELTYLGCEVAQKLADVGNVLSEVAFITAHETYDSSNEG